MTELLSRFVSSEGRISRSQYVVFFAIPCVGLTAFTWLVLVAAPEPFDALPTALVTLPWIALLASADAQHIKRYHDLGNSGRIYTTLKPMVVLLPILAMAVQFVLPSFMAMSGDMSALAFLIDQEFSGWRLGPVPLAMLGVTIVAMLYNTTYLAALPGQRGPNAYGADPLAGLQLPGAPLNPGARKNDPVKQALAEHQAAARSARVAPASRTPGASFGKKRP